MQYTMQILNVSDVLHGHAVNFTTVRRESKAVVAMSFPLFPASDFELRRLLIIKNAKIGANVHIQAVTHAR